MSSPDSPKKANGLAITSLVLGICSLSCCFALTSIPAIITGHIAHRRAKSNPETHGGTGMALAGLFLGYLSVVLTILLAVLTIPALPKIQARVQAIEAQVHEQQIYSAVEKSGSWPADAKITSSADLIKALRQKNAASDAEIATYHIGDFQIGNVSANDAPRTIFIRTRPGLLQDGAVVVFYVDGSGQIYENGAAIQGTPPPREPNYLSD
jgi:hypothetical protein